MSTLVVTIISSVIVFVIFLGFQIKYFTDTKKHREIFQNFFEKNRPYSSVLKGYDNDLYPEIAEVGKDNSDLNSLIKEINIYLYKTKGTSDYEFVRNKVERKLNMRYDQSTVHLAFPTYLGLMGTFMGVFMGISTFLWGFDGNGSVSDDSIRNLLVGVLVSMGTSLVGLFLTTINNHYAGEARKKIEDDKNEFYDFIQTDVTKTASASLVSAISKLHDTVDKFEPAFSTVIEGFKKAFDDCTKAFGDDFKQNVRAVTDAVNVMGANMDKINKNIDLQERLLATLKSGELIKGLDKYIEASNHFVSITQSLNKFEEARRMMLAAAQEAIALQNKYNEDLKVPREIAVRVNQILDRIKDFENSVNEAGHALTKRDILGNDIIEAIRDQIKGISKKGKIADKYLEMADVKLENLYTEQTKVISEMNTRYKEAIKGHIEGFENMLTKQTEELESRHSAFIQAIEEKFNIEDIRQEFTNLRKLDEIETKLAQISSTVSDNKDISESIKSVRNSVQEVKRAVDTKKIEVTVKQKGGLFGWGSDSNDKNK
jgi:citrate lyase gamma subunit